MGLQEKWLQSHSMDDLVREGAGQAMLGGQVMDVQAGDFLFREGDTSHDLYFILSGSVLVYQERPEGNVTLAELKPSEFIGEMGSLQGVPRSAHAMALVPTRVLVIPEAEVDRAITQLPRWFVRLVDTLIDRLRETDRRIHDV
jgi:CRP-like cAMP-binding protein